VQGHGADRKEWGDNALELGDQKEESFRGCMRGYFTEEIGDLRTALCMFWEGGDSLGGSEGERVSCVVKVVGGFGLGWLLVVEEAL
jgi:hypothetical protein